MKTFSKMVNKMSQRFLVALFCFFGVVSGDDSLATKCSPIFPKVTVCLPFATAKTVSPTDECCTSVTDLRAIDPGCLCFVIQQVHNGKDAELKEIGAQESRLVHLPSACNLVNASITECPRLLHLPLNSTDAAIFNDNFTDSALAPVAIPWIPSTTPVNSGFWRKPCTKVSVIVALAMFFLAFSST